MKIVHLADLHLGYRSYNKLDENGFNMRELDVIEAFRESLRKINDIQPDLIIIAGDVFHKPRPSNLTLFQTIHRLHVFRKHCKAPIVIISGNHESVKSIESGNVLSILEKTTENLFVIDGKIKELEFKELNALVVGIPYNALSEIKNNSLIPDKSYTYNILSMHCSYDSAKCPELSKYGHEELVNSDKINGAEWDYVALGHYHKYIKLEKNIYYSGAIERTSSNIWQEAKDPKGFIEYNLDTKEIKFHELETPRQVYDIKKINAENLTAEDINKKIDEIISGVKDLENSIVRITLENIDTLAIRNLDYNKIREYRKKAVHFMLNFIKKGQDFDFENEKTGKEKRKNLADSLEEELKTFELAQGLSYEKFNNLAKEYFMESVL